jgi:hypothetical protein
MGYYFVSDAYQSLDLALVIYMIIIHPPIVYNGRLCFHLLKPPKPKHSNALLQAAYHGHLIKIVYHHETPA